MKGEKEEEKIKTTQTNLNKTTHNNNNNHMPPSKYNLHGKKMYLTSYPVQK